MKIPKEWNLMLLLTAILFLIIGKQFNLNQQYGWIIIAAYFTVGYILLQKTSHKQRRM